MSNLDYVGPPVLQTTLGPTSPVVIGTFEVLPAHNNLHVEYRFSVSSISTYGQLEVRSLDTGQVWNVYGLGFTDGDVGTNGDMAGYIVDSDHPPAGTYQVYFYDYLPYYPGTIYVSEVHFHPGTIEPPDNDDFAAAVEISGGGEATYTTVGASAEVGEPYHTWAGEPQERFGGSIWFRYQPQRKEIFYVLVQSLTGSSPEMSAYEGTELNKLTRISNAYDIQRPWDNPSFTFGRYSYVMINGDPGKTYHIAIEDWAEVTVQWITEDDPRYQFYGPPTLLMTQDFGPEGLLFPDTENPTLNENWGYSNAITYGSHVVYDDFPPLGDVFEGDHYFWQPCMVGDILYAPYRDNGDHGGAVIGHDEIRRQQIWVWEDGLLYPPVKTRFDKAIKTAERELNLNFTDRIVAIMYGDGHIWGFVQAPEPGYLLKFNLAGDLVDTFADPQGVGYSFTGYTQITDTEFIDYHYNGATTVNLRLWDLRDLSYVPTAFTNSSNFGGTYDRACAFADGRILGVKGGGFHDENDPLDTFELTLYDNTWRDSLDVLETWTVTRPDTSPFDKAYVEGTLLSRDETKFYWTRFFEPYPGHQRFGPSQYDRNLLGGNWIIVTVYAFDLATGTNEEVGRYEYNPRWSGIGGGPNWYFPQWLIDADVKLRPAVGLHPLTARVAKHAPR